MSEMSNGALLIMMALLLILFVALYTSDDLIKCKLSGGDWEDSDCECPEVKQYEVCESFETAKCKQINGNWNCPETFPKR